MFLRRYPSNGVPWLVWLSRDRWHCEGCGRSGSLPGSDDVATFARALGDLKRSHHGCGPGAEVRVWGAGVGHPLNPDRAEP